jgi:hypothetical protein
MTVIDSLRLVYSSIYITNDDTPEERRAWMAAKPADQNAAARDYHLNYGGKCPAWALSNRT